MLCINFEKLQISQYYIYFHKVSVGKLYCKMQIVHHGENSENIHAAKAVSRVKWVTE